MAADSPTMFLEDLPPELFDDIFKFLVHDKASLRSCALVSTRWHRLAIRSRLAIVEVSAPNHGHGGAHHIDAFRR